MPRKRQTLSGAPAAPAVAPVDSTYGEGERSIESQRRMPVPQLTGSGSSASQSMPSMPSGGEGRTTIPTDRQARLEMAMQALQRMPPPPGLAAPSARPNEPFTSGMNLGAGPGAEVLRPGDRVARTLRQIADMTDNTRLRELADLANMRGGM